MNKVADKDMLKSIGERILKKNETIAVAESVTAGYLQFAISAIPDASKFFQGGVTAFNIGQKFKHLRVEPLHALSVNCVSEKVATEMALHVCGLFSSDWGIGITGYASPVPESDNTVFAYYAITHKDKVLKSGKLTPPDMEPVELQQEYANLVLQELSGLL
jgi:PncC family amidohydrolase